jgi:DNA-binding CsgD family transcriptional regulator
MSKPKSTPTQAAIRFWSRIEKQANGCWIWTGARGGYRRHYGVFNPTGRYPQVYTHRFAYELAHGPIPSGMYVCHNCPTGDNPLCCNPDHLFLGTPTDNVQDALRKNQVPRGINSGSFQHRTPVVQSLTQSSFADSSRPRGERNGNARLTAVQVREIRKIAASGTMTYTEIAQMFRIARSTVHQIISGRSWRHIVAQEGLL